MTPIGNIRLAGINEHFERVQFFMNHAERYEDPIDKFRFEMAAIYSCRAISELMFEAAGKQETWDPKSPDAKIIRSDLEGLIATQIPYYSLIERIRIHDFHRFGMLPPNPEYKTSLILGPLKLKAQKGGINVQLTDAGLETTSTGNSKAKFRPWPPKLEYLKLPNKPSKVMAEKEVYEKITIQRGADHINYS